jgi:glycosyltransferase involved in cell wall biosynthesis
VTESLAFGKPCLISDRTSLPEAGGNLARYQDPEDLHGWYAAIRQILEDRTQLAEWETRIRREFEPVPWSATIDALIGGLSHFPADRSENCADMAAGCPVVAAAAAG